MKSRDLLYSLKRSLTAWEFLVPPGRLVAAFGMPFAGMGVFRLLCPDAPLPTTVVVLSGVVASAFTGLAFILGAVHKHYHADILNRHLSCTKTATVPPFGLVFVILLLLAAIGWIGVGLGTSFLVACAFLAVLHSAFSLLFHDHRLAGSLVAAAIGAMQCMLPFFQGRPQCLATPVIMAGVGIGMLQYGVFFILLYYRPRKPGPVDFRRLQEGWHLFAVYMLLSVVSLAALAYVKAPLAGCAIAALVLAWGGWGCHRVVKRLTRPGIRAPERARTAALLFGLPTASLQTALLFGRGDTVMAGGLLLLAAVVVNRRRLGMVAPTLPSRISEGNICSHAPADA